MEYSNVLQELCIFFLSIKHFFFIEVSCQCTSMTIRKVILDKVVSTETFLKCKDNSHV